MTFKSKYTTRDQSALNEATDRPIFLFQRRIWVLIQVPFGYELEDGMVYESLFWKIENQVEEWHDGKGPDGQELHEYLGWTEAEYARYVEEGDKAIPRRHYEDWEPESLTWEQLAEKLEGEHDAPCAICYWETERVFLTRQEANEFGAAKHYNYRDGWRVYAVPTHGELREALADGTEMTLKNK